MAGVVYSRYNVEAVEALNAEISEGRVLDQMETLEFTPAGDVAPGEYMLLVVHGPAQVNVAAGSSTLAAGSLLSTSALAGQAGTAVMVEMTNGLSMAMPGTVLGKAMEPLLPDQNQIYVYVTLN